LDRIFFASQQFASQQVEEGDHKNR
jgi:hypothetical protein